LTVVHGVINTELHEEEKILASYAEDILQDDDDDDDPTKIFNLAGSNLEFEFVRAFELIANGEDSISKEKIAQVFSAIGLTFQSWDIDR
jgi:hypothetical protein